MYSGDAPHGTTWSFGIRSNSKNKTEWFIFPLINESIAGPIVDGLDWIGWIGWMDGLDDHLLSTPKTFFSMLCFVECFGSPLQEQSAPPNVPCLLRQVQY
mmetsp:Transcript_32152/g.75621  ORF Transcript_32152/g.75621 Transcript_32152/m.75621 type:complete len:100 (+) Transcript_32152:401-700(+)